QSALELEGPRPAGHGEAHRELARSLAGGILGKLVGEVGRLRLAGRGDLGQIRGALDGRVLRYFAGPAPVVAVVVVRRRSSVVERLEVRPGYGVRPRVV